MIQLQRSEFGIRVRYHVPQAHAMMIDHGPLPVEIEPGEEALYPLASHHVVAPQRFDDDNRRGGPRRLYHREERFIPKPHCNPDWTNPAHVCICPRARDYGSAKNWPHWPELARALEDEGLHVTAAGAPDSSVECGVPCAWEFQRFTDASIAMLLGARLVIATDAGLAHLAILCGRPLLLLTHHGLIAPGPQVDATGKVLAPAYGPVKLGRYYHAANWKGVPIHSAGSAWTNWRSVVSTAVLILKLNPGA